MICLGRCYKMSLRCSGTGNILPQGEGNNKNITVLMFGIIQKVYQSNSKQEKQVWRIKNMFRLSERQQRIESNFACSKPFFYCHDKAFFLILCPSVVPGRLLTLLDVSWERKLGVIFKNGSKLEIINPGTLQLLWFTS